MGDVKKVCMLVDDDEDDAEIFLLALAEASKNTECRIARDGYGALDMLEDGSFIPDYIFLDLNMPRMSGKECLAEIRKRPQLCNTPVIIFSTSASHLDILDTKALGASFFITKPSQLSTLVAKLSEVLHDDMKWSW